MRLSEHPRFDIEDFSSRWERARLSALRSVLQDAGVSTSVDAETQLLAQIRSENKEILLRRVFDYSRQFGLSASRYLGMSLEVQDLVEILQTSPVPCFRGSWRSHNSAFVLERVGCEVISDVGNLACDFWREALDGLIMGVGENERLARHRSVGHGDSECVDVLFTEEFSIPRVVPSSNLEPVTPKFGALPIDLETALQDVRKYFESMKVQLRFAGLSEGVLYYELKTEDGVLCGAGGRLMHESLLREISKRFPSLKTQDVSPLAVYGGAS